MKKKLLIILLFPFLTLNSLYAKSLYFEEGVNFFQSNEFKKAQLKFEQDIVYNPKSELSYLYLSKIFKNLDKKDLQENNLNTVILINPKNEEAILNLAKLKLSTSDYKKSNDLNNSLSSFCKKLCNESRKLKIEIEKLSAK